LDQMYADDQGYNALEAMAKGKVVFTGAGKPFMEHYDLTEKVNINALPDVDYLVNELSFLIENPESIVAIGKRAKAFIAREHEYINIASQYVEAWDLKTTS
ncbi:MAG: glycosyltransferase family 1 protein, partial [Methylotenera sp.]|nr:glycosyltransferase family 1 protein [Flavobacterium sp.]